MFSLFIKSWSPGICRSTGRGPIFIATTGSVSPVHANVSQIVILSFPLQSFKSWEADGKTDGRCADQSCLCLRYKSLPRISPLLLACFYLLAQSAALNVMKDSDCLEIKKGFIDTCAHPVSPHKASSVCAVKSPCLARCPHGEWLSLCLGPTLHWLTHIHRVQAGLPPVYIYYHYKTVELIFLFFLSLFICFMLHVLGRSH